MAKKCITIKAVDVDRILLELEDGTSLVEQTWKYGKDACIRNGTFQGMVRAGIQFDVTTTAVMPGQKLMGYVSHAADGRITCVPDWKTYKEHPLMPGAVYEEGTRQENKQSFNAQSWQSGKVTLLAMFNTVGGRLTFGVSDRGEVLGVDGEILRRGGRDKVKDFIINNFKQDTANLLYTRLNVYFEVVNRRTLCHVEIPASNEDVPALFHDKILPVRIGAQTHKLTSCQDMIKWSVDRAKNRIKFNS